MIAGIVAVYGPEGSCWDLPGVSEEDCLTECLAHLETLRSAYPDIPECWACSSDADCENPGLPECDLDSHTCVEAGISWQRCDGWAADSVCVDFVGGRTQEEKDEFCDAWFDGSHQLSTMPCRTENVVGKCEMVYELVVFYSDGGYSWPEQQATSWCADWGGEWIPGG